MLDREKLVPSALYFAVGFAPITALSLSLLELVPLSLGVIILVIPAWAAGVLYGLIDRKSGLLALTGLLFGILSVFTYDAIARFPFIVGGLMADFIPRIHGWLTGAGEGDWKIGYAWRYLGNGGGMGLAFTVVYSQLKPKLDPRLAGILFGLAVWSCLMATLLLAPNGEAKLFPLRAFTIVISFLGHVVYGATLGSLNLLSARANLAAQTQLAEP